MYKLVFTLLLAFCGLALPQTSYASFDPPPVERGVEKQKQKKRKKHKRKKRPKKQKYVFIEDVWAGLACSGAIVFMVGGFVLLLVGFLGPAPIPWMHIVGTIGIFAALAMIPLYAYLTTDSGAPGIEALAAITGIISGLVWLGGGIAMHVLGARHGFPYLLKLGLAFWLIVAIAAFVALVIILLLAIAFSKIRR